MTRIGTPQQLIQSIHDSPIKLNLVITGGGSGLISELLSVGGASRTLQQACIPYSQESLSRFLGSKPESFCSAETAQAMAVKAYLEWPSLADGNFFGLSINAAIATNRPKSGSHRFYLAIQGESLSRLVEVKMAKGARSRTEEEEFIIKTGLNEIARLVDINFSPPERLDGDSVIAHQHSAQSQWVELFHGKRRFCRTDGELLAPHGKGILSGSFNPIHRGHLEMAQTFRQRYGLDVEFELPLINADKLPLDFLSLQQRISSFHQQPVWLSRNATFAEKSISFPGNFFLLGADTITRVADPKFYPGKTALKESMAIIKKNKCRFVVFGRQQGNKFLTLKALDLPAALRELCDEIPESEFSNPVSSTAIRQGLKPGF